MFILFFLDLCGIHAYTMYAYKYQLNKILKTMNLEDYFGMVKEKNCRGKCGFLSFKVISPNCGYF